MKVKSRILALLLAVMCVLPLFASMTVKAGVGQADAYNSLLNVIQDGKYQPLTDNLEALNFNEKEYKTSGGGYKFYSELIVVGSGTSGNIIDDTAFQSLTSGAKQDFLTDVISLANLASYDCMEGDGQIGVDDSTVNQFLVSLQNKTGMGSQLLATLMSETKPDFASANRIYKPFSGPVGTILGIISVLILALLGITMVNDIAFIVIPAYQLILGGTNEGDKGGAAKALNKIVSVEARRAVEAVENSGSGGQSGEGNKQACWIYLKARIVGLIILGICLLYLVQGQIYSLVSWIIDLMSGFLGF